MSRAEMPIWTERQMHMLAGMALRGHALGLRNAYPT